MNERAPDAIAVNGKAIRVLKRERRRLLNERATMLARGDDWFEVVARSFALDVLSKIIRELRGAKAVKRG